VILYHGTTVPIESIRRYGLLVYHPDWVKDLIFSRLSNPDKYLSYITKAIKTLGGGPLGTYSIPGLYFSEDKELAEMYVWSIPEELAYAFIMATPSRFRKALLESLVETQGDKLIGKLITLEIPDEWKNRPGVAWQPPDDIMFPFNVGPQYITGVEISDISWSEVLEPYLEL